MMRNLFCRRKLWRHRWTIAIFALIAFLLRIRSAALRGQEILVNNARFAKRLKSADRQVQFDYKYIDSKGEHYIHHIPGHSPRNFSANEVALCVHLGLEQLAFLPRLVAAWSCPVSAAVYADEAGYQTIVKAFLACHVGILQHVTLHVVRPLREADLRQGGLSDYVRKFVRSEFIGDVDACADLEDTLKAYKRSVYPVNLLRNVALKDAGRRFVLNSDVTVLPSRGACGQLKRFLEARFSRYSVFDDPPAEAFVLPCYESTPPAEAPTEQLTKRSLMQLVRKGRARPHLTDVCPECQQNTDFSRWERLESADEQVYQVRWSHPYEPYFVAMKSALPKFDERFLSTANDRLSQACELHLSGWEFYVFGDAFLLHTDVASSREIADARQLALEAGIYGEFVGRLAKKYPDSNLTCAIPPKFTF